MWQVLSCSVVLSFGDVVVKAVPLRSRSCQRVVSGICWASRVRVAILWRQVDESSAGDAFRQFADCFGSLEKSITFATAKARKPV